MCDVVGDHSGCSMNKARSSFISNRRLTHFSIKRKVLNIRWLVQRPEPRMRETFVVANTWVKLFIVSDNKPE